MLNAADGFSAVSSDDDHKKPRRRNKPGSRVCFESAEVSIPRIVCACSLSIPMIAWRLCVVRAGCLLTPSMPCRIDLQTDGQFFPRRQHCSAYFSSVFAAEAPSVLSSGVSSGAFSDACPPPVMPFSPLSFVRTSSTSLLRSTNFAISSGSSGAF